MSALNCIDCKVEQKTKAHVFGLSIFSESSLNGNISVFEDLNIVQIDIKKTHIGWSDCLTIWGGDQKTEVQILGI